jgi:uncharacterized protein YkwD
MVNSRNRFGTYDMGKLAEGTRTASGWVQGKNSVTYQFTLSKSSHYQVTAKGQRVDLGLQLRNAGGKLLQSVDRWGTRAEVLGRKLEAGTYFLQVSLKGRGRKAYELKTRVQSLELGSGESGGSGGTGGFSGSGSGSGSGSNPTFRPGSNGDGISAEERKLYNLINNYRAQKGLSPIPWSKALSTTANRHVQDLTYKVKYLTHGWSDAPYVTNDTSTYGSMWNAPQRLNTGYPGYGYENAAWGSAGISADMALNLWKNSPGHNAVMVNEGIWADNVWKAVGVGIYGNYAVLWVGEEADPTGLPVFE